MPQTRKENGVSEHHTFGTAINCMDGRTQKAVLAYLEERYGLDYVDLITEPGPAKILGENIDEAVVASIKNRVKISVEKHHSKVIAIVAHPDCAGNPVDQAQQMEDLQAAYSTVRSFGFRAEVILLWVEKNWRTVVKIKAREPLLAQ